MREQLSGRKKPFAKSAATTKKNSSPSGRSKTASTKAKPQVAVKKASTKITGGKKVVATKKIAATKKAGAKSLVVKKTGAKKVAAKKVAAKKPIAKQLRAKKVVAKKVAAKKVVAKKVVAKKPVAKQLKAKKVTPKIAPKVTLKSSATTKLKQAKKVIIAKPLPKPKTVRSVKVLPKPLAPGKLSLRTPPAPPVIARRQMATQALRAFEQAVKVFNLREFSEAKHLFEEVQKQYQQEVEIIARSHTYIQICNVRLAGARSAPRNADEFYDRGVVALNIGNFVQARSFFEKALKLRPDDSYTLYSLAATHAQAGAPDQALSYLEQAVQRQPRLRHQALNDSDFSVLKEDRRFLELLGATSPFDLLESRRDLP